MKSNVIKLNTLRLNSANLNVVGEEQNLSLSAGGDPEQPPVEPPVVPVTYILSASASNGVVSASVNGNAVTLPVTANEGDVVVVEVTANDGYVFEGWSDGSTDNPRTITMHSDVTLSATCVVKAVEKEYIQFEDPAVETVLMANNVSSDGIGITMEDAAKVTSIGTWFKGNTEITSFGEFVYFKNCTTLATSAFQNCTSLRSIDLSNMETIGNYAFWGCSALETISAKKANLIGSYSFMRCTNLKMVDASPNEVDSFAFDGCQNLEFIGFENLTIIGKNAFYNCRSLKSVELNASVSSIGNSAFVYCIGLPSFVSRATTPPTLDSNAFGNTTCPIYVPDASLEAYKTATNWNTYADRIHPLSEIEGSNGVTLYDRLYGDGVAYIATDYYLKGNERINCKAQNVFVDNKNRWMFGAFDGSRMTGICTGGGSNASKVQYVLYYGSDDYLAYDYIGILYDSVEFFIQRTNGGWGSYAMAINGSAVGITDAPFCIFSNAENPTYPFKGWLGSVIVTDTDTSEVLAKFTPASYNGEAGMYDEISGKFYGNASDSGAFYVENE